MIPTTAQKACGVSSSGNGTFMPKSEATIVGIVSKIVRTVSVLIVVLRLFAKMASVAADAGVNGHVLLAVGATISDGRTHHA